MSDDVWAEVYRIRNKKYCEREGAPVVDYQRDVQRTNFWGFSYFWGMLSLQAGTICCCTDRNSSGVCLGMKNGVNVERMTERKGTQCTQCVIDKTDDDCKIDFVSGV